MKRKVLVLSTVILFLTGMIIVPAYCFVSEFIVPEKLYSELNVKSFSKNIVFTASKKINFGGFTNNLLGAADKNTDFSNIPALLSKNEQKTYFSFANSFKSHNFDYTNHLAYDFTVTERLRCFFAGHSDRVLFIFFILLYIGMLKAVFVFYKKSNIFYIFRPLFAQTGVFYLRVSK